MSEEIGTNDEWTVACDVVGEIDGFVKSVAGVDLDAVRTGVGVGPSEVLAARGDLFTLTSCSVSFPMRSRATIPDDRVVHTRAYALTELSLGHQNAPRGTDPFEHHARWAR